MTKQMSRMLLFVGLFFTIIFGWYGIKKGFMMIMMSRYSPPPVTVTANMAVQKIWYDTIESVGSMHAVNGVDLSTEVPGIVSRIYINSGQAVNAGDVVLELENNIEKAAVKEQTARLKLARLSYERDKKLFERNVSAQSTLDARFAELQQAEAAFDAASARLKQKIITSPFSGRAGIRLVEQGQFVSPGTPLVTVQSLNPLYIDFNVPERYVPLLTIGGRIEAHVNFPAPTVIPGKITAINAKVDPITRNILVQATIDNASRKFYPGMYALIKIWFTKHKPVIVIPQTAVSYNLSGDYVFLIKQEGKLLRAHRQYVTTGERRGDQVSITTGLKAGDRIVSSGQLKLQQGSVINIDTKTEM